jgi:starch-binding outer membrane protein SusE/F
MKNKIIFLIAFIGVIMFASCKKDEDRATLKKDVTPMGLNNLSASAFVLTLDNAATTFQTFTWSSADYGFKAAVTYRLQMDKSGNNFASSVDLVTVINKDTAVMNVGDLNKALLNLGLDPDAAANVQFRVKAWVSDSVPPVYSNVVAATITPYATTFPPIYMCGDATGGWSWDKSVEVRSSAPSVYGTIVYFTSGNFRFFKQKDWGPTSYNYPYFTTVSNLFVNANDGDSNFKFTGTPGYFQITADLKNKTVTAATVPEPTMYMIGDAVNGWNTGTAIKLTWLSDGIYSATTTFTNGGAFRFFVQADWGAISYNYPAFAEGTVDPLFVNANDGDKNFKFTGTTGSYTITLNMLTKTVVMVKI